MGFLRESVWILIVNLLSLYNFLFRKVGFCFFYLLYPGKPIRIGHIECSTISHPVIRPLFFMYFIISSVSLFWYYKVYKKMSLLEKLKLIISIVFMYGGFVFISVYTLSYPLNLYAVSISLLILVIAGAFFYDFIKKHHKLLF